MHYLLIILTCKTIRHVENAFCSPATQQNTNYTFLVADFTHAVEVVNHAEKDQRVHHHFTGSYFLARHFVDLYTEWELIQNYIKWKNDNKFCPGMRRQKMSIHDDICNSNYGIIQFYL